MGLLILVIVEFFITAACRDSKKQLYIMHNSSVYTLCPLCT